MKKAKAITALEMMYKLTLRDDFDADVKQIRDDFKIPRFRGFNDEVRNDFKKLCSMVDVVDVTVSASDLLRKYHFSSSYIRLFQNYILFGLIDEIDDGMKYVGYIDPDAHKRKNPFLDLEALGIKPDPPAPFVEVRLYANITKTDAHAFIDAKWKEIEGIFQSQGCKPIKRIKPKENKLRDKLIVMLSRYSKEALGDKNAAYLDVLVQKKLEEMFGYKVSEGYIRKIMSKYRKGKS